MMVDDPYDYADVIAPYSDYYMFHAEATSDPVRTIQKIRKNWPNVKVGLYFNLSTDILQYKDILSLIDCIGLMGISPGVLGTSSYYEIVSRKIDSYRLEKATNFHQDWPEFIFIDGSVNFSTIPNYLHRLYGGITPMTFVCGSSSIMNNLKETTIEENIKKIENSIL